MRTPPSNISKVGVMSFKSLQVTPLYQGSFAAASSWDVVLDLSEWPLSTESPSAFLSASPTSRSGKTGGVAWATEN